MPVDAKHEAVNTAPRPRRMAYADTKYLFYGELERRGGGDIRNDAEMNLALTLQDAEVRCFVGCRSVPLAIATASEVGLSKFDLAAQQVRGILGVAQDGHTVRADSPAGGPIGQHHLIVQAVALSPVAIRAEARRDVCIWPLQTRPFFY
jgi:hypothetical protein